jgi:hypothetical protein
LFTELVLVFPVDGPELLGVRRGKLHDPVDELDLCGVKIRPEKLEIIVYVIIHRLGRLSGVRQV